MLRVVILLLAPALLRAEHYDNDKDYNESYEDDWVNADKSNQQVRETFEEEGLTVERAEETTNWGGDEDQSGYESIEERGKQLDNFKEEVGLLQSTLRSSIESKTVEEVKSYLNSDAGSLALLQWRLLKAISDNGNSIDTKYNGWLLNNREALEMLLTSGDIQGDRYERVVHMFTTLLIKDPLIKSKRLRLRLAVATAITFTETFKATGSTRHIVALVGRPTDIDGIKRYCDFVKWHEEGVLYKPFEEVTAWHLRYVVGSWQRSDELKWARENALASYRSPEKIANAARKMVKYTRVNDEGTSVQKGAAAFYKGRPMTLQTIHEMGGVCGAISRFGVGMAQAHGVPALLVTQPGHCAHIYYVNGKWKIGNDVSGWAASNTHSQIAYTWLRPSVYFQLMNEAQADLTNYRLSEKLRYASRLAGRGDKFLVLEEASNVCPQNFDVWHDMKDAIYEGRYTLDKIDIQNAILPSLARLTEESDIALEESDIALEKPVTSTSFDNAQKMTDNSFESALCKEPTADFEVDLGKSSSIREIKFHWWGYSKPKTYRIYGKDVLGNWKLIRTNLDESVVGWFNSWSTLPGFVDRVWGIRVEMENGKLDPWNKGVWIGIRGFIVLGVQHDTEDDVVLSNNMHPTANPESSDPMALDDNNSGTVWKSDTDKSWFEIDLKKMCTLSYIKFEWADGARADKIEVSYGSEEEAVLGGEGTPEIMQLGDVAASRVHVSLRGGNHALRGVEVVGVVYGVRQVLKMVVDDEMGDYPQVTKTIKTAIDEWDYRF